MTQSRAERKEVTRRAILDAALELCEESSLVALSLRQVTARVGIVPTAFYRHFDSLDALGLILVEESFASLRAMLRDVRRSAAGALGEIVDGSISSVVEHVRGQHHRHFAFILRERNAGPLVVRTAVRRQIDLVTHELATDLGLLPGTASWSTTDLERLAALYVIAVVGLVESILEAGGDPAAEADSIAGSRTQLRMVLVGALNWKSHT